MIRVSVLAVLSLAITGCQFEVPNSAASAQKPDAPEVVEAPQQVAVVKPDPKPPVETAATPEARPVVEAAATPPAPVVEETTGPLFETTPQVAQKASIQTTGVDTCGAADFAFLVGEPFAITFDIALPGNAVVIGRSQKMDNANPARMLVRVSTRSGASAQQTPDAKIIAVSCG